MNNWTENYDFRNILASIMCELWACVYSTSPVSVCQYNNHYNSPAFWWCVQMCVFNVSLQPFLSKFSIDFTFPTVCVQNAFQIQPIHQSTLFNTFKPLQISPRKRFTSNLANLGQKHTFVHFTACMYDTILYLLYYYITIFTACTTQGVFLIIYRVYFR